MCKYLDLSQWLENGTHPYIELPDDTMVIDRDITELRTEFRLCHSSSTSKWFVLMQIEDDPTSCVATSGSWVECARYYSSQFSYIIGWEDAPMEFGKQYKSTCGNFTCTPYWTNDKTGEEKETDDGWTYEVTHNHYRILVQRGPYLPIDDGCYDNIVKNHNGSMRFDEHVFDNLISMVEELEMLTGIKF